MDPLSPDGPDHSVPEVATAPVAPSRVPQGRCRQCGRRDAPIRALDLCEACEAVIAAEVHARIGCIRGLFKLLGETGDLATKRAHYTRLLQEAEALQRYEQRGILTTCPSPSTLVADFRAKRAALEREAQRGRKTPSISNRPG